MFDLFTQIYKKLLPFHQITEFVKQSLHANSHASIAKLNKNMIGEERFIKEKLNTISIVIYENII